MNLTFYTRPNTTGHSHVITVNFASQMYRWKYGFYNESEMIARQAIMISKRDFDRILASLKYAGYDEVWESEDEQEDV